MIKAICSRCNKEYSIYPYRKSTTKFCSRECQSIFKEGKHYSPSTEYKKGCIPIIHYKKGHISWSKLNKGKYSLEIRNRMSKAHIGHKLSKETIKKVLRRRPKSSLELKFEEIINKFNLPYKFVGNGQFFIERKNPDFININGEKIAIEVFYRRHKNIFRGNNNDWKNVEDWKQKRQEIFAKYGWKIIFLDETQVNEDFIKNNLLNRGG